MHGVVALAAVGLAFVACSDKETPSESGSGGSTSAGGTGATGAGGAPASGGGTNTLDRDALAANCDGLEAVQDASCTQANLVCQDGGGTSCVCGGVSSTNQTGTGTGGGPGSGAGGRFGGGPPAQPAPEPAGALVWECFEIGQGEPMGGAGGEGPGGLGGDGGLGGIGGAN